MVVDITRHVVYRIHKIISMTRYSITLKWLRYISPKAWFSLNVPQLRLQPIGAEHPLRNLIEWVSIIRFGLHPKKECLKLSVCPKWRRQWFWPSARNKLFRPSVGSNFKKKIWSAVAWEHAWSMIIKWIFSPMHTVGSTGPASKNCQIKTNQVKSYNALAQL